MSEPSSYVTFESEEESSGWFISSEALINDDDELTLLNGDENSDDDSLLDDDFIKLSQRLKEQYHMQEATVALERCDKIWDTMQLLKNIQHDNTMDDDGQASSRSNSCAPREEAAKCYIKYQPVQGNGNNALPNFVLAVKSQRKVYHCVTCGRQYSEKRALRIHSEKEHGIIMPLERHRVRSAKTENGGEPPTLRSKTPSSDDKIMPCPSNENGDKSRLSNSSKYNSAETERGQRPTFEQDTTNTGSAVKLTRHSTELDKLLGLNCALCDKTLPDRKSLTKHSIRAHGICPADAKKQSSPSMKRQVSVATAETGRETCRTRQEGGALRRKVGRPSNASRETAAHPETIDHKTKYFKDHYRMIDGVPHRILNICKTCGKTFYIRKALRKHTKEAHGLVIPPVVFGETWIENAKGSKIYQVELVKASSGGVRMARGAIWGQDISSRRPKVTDKNVKESKRPRAGIERPRRTCALRTSYTECTKEEEEEVGKSLLFNPASPPKSPPAQTTNCFLCKQSFVDIRRHLVDYHRINSPESVLPLTAKAEPEEKKQQEEEEEDPNISVIVEANGRKRFRCNVCLFKYKHIKSVERHLKQNTVRGVVQNHVAWTPERRGYHEKSINYRATPQDPLADPLALSDASEASKSNSTKRMRSSWSDECLTSSPEPDAKKQKIQDSETDGEADNRCESRSDSVQEEEEDSVDRDSVIVLSSESDSRSVQESSRSWRCPNHRETRESSDRDSGIGISITIKKRNNSYEVVDKDCTDDNDKAKDLSNSKDNNLLCFDSWSDVTTTTTSKAFVSYDREARRREILNSIDCSENENLLGSSLRTDCRHHVENEKRDRGSSNEAEEGRYREEAGTKIDGYTYYSNFRVPPDVTREKIRS